MNPPFSPTAELILRDTVGAMQQAEELGGCRGVEYICLMEAISRTALQRARVYATDVHNQTQSLLTRIASDHDHIPSPPLPLDRLEPVARQFGITPAEVREICAYRESRQ